MLFAELIQQRRQAFDDHLGNGRFLFCTVLFQEQIIFDGEPRVNGANCGHPVAFRFDAPSLQRVN